MERKHFEKARQLLPDVILLDISMPGLNGFETTRLLRQLEVADAKILIMSQNDPALLLPRAIEAGAQGCVDKARLFTDLLPSIESLAGGSPRSSLISVVGRCCDGILVSDSTMAD